MKKAAFCFRRNGRFVIGAILMGLLPLTQVLAQTAVAQHTQPMANVPGQTVSTGHESAKGEINFTELANYYKLHPQPLVVKMLENEDDNERPSVTKPYDSSLVHIRHSSLEALTGSGHEALLPASPNPIDTFESTLDNGTSIPPDTHGDINGTYCVTAINTTVKIQTRTGAAVSSMSLDAFWTAVLPGGGSFDPRVFFDRYTDRWYMIADANGELASSSLLVAVSKTNSPTGGWYEFIVPVGITGDWVDYPTVGFNKKWIAVGGNPFGITSGTSDGAVVYVFNKALLVAGTSATYTKITEASSFTICPAVMYDTVDQNLFAVESWDGTAGTLQLWKITGPVGTPAMAVVGQPSSAPFKWQFQSSLGGGGGDFAPQLGTTNKIQNNDDRIFDLKYINGNLWCSHNVFLPATGTTTHCSAQWWQFDTLANPVQIGYVNDNSVTNPNFYYFPGIAVNTYNDVLIGLSTSSALTHVNAAYAMHMHTDATDSTRPVYIYRHGQAAYYKTFGGGRDRWGDYSQSSLDTNGVDFWTIQETVAAGTNLWDTWWAYVQVCQKPPATITATGSTSVCTPATVTLNANTGTGLTYQWEVGGTIIAGATTTTYTASVTGTYNVIVYNSATCDSTSLPVVVSVNPLPTAILGAATLCNGGTTNLSDATTGGTWSTTSGTVSVGTSGIVTGLGAGTGTISYTSAAGCVITTVVTVNAGPTATITPAGPTTFCTGGSVVLNASTGAGLTYQWQTGGVNIVGSTTSAYTATAAGNYDVIVYQGACSTTSSVTTVTVVTAPTVTAIGGSTTNVCNGQTITLTDATTGGTWSSSNGAVATVSTAGVVTGASLGTVNISYTITNICGSISASTIVTVNVPTVVAAVTGNVDICVGGTTTLSDVTALGVWGSSNAGVATVNTSGLVTGMSAGTANISYSVTNASGCASSAYTTVTVSSPFTAVITPLGSTTFCPGGNVVLNATTGTGFTYQWQLGGINITGATMASYTATTGGNYTVLIADPGGCTSNSASITVTESTGFTVTPSVSVSASLGTVLCTTTSPETFTPIPVNGGTTPTYQWYVNGVVSGAGATYSYTPANGDVVKVLMTSNAPCAFPDTASGSVTVTISPLLTAAVSITSIHGDSTCTGDTVQFAAVPVNGGTAPTYMWTENGINVATGPYYIYAPHDGDTLTVTMTTNYPCIASPVVVSNIFIIHVYPYSTNALSVAVSQSSIMAGLVDTFTAVATGAGSSPAFQWFINGNPVAGATAYKYITDSLHDGQIVNCEETSSFVCSSPHSIFSGGLSISVVPNGVQQVGNNPGHFTLLPNPNKGDFTINGTTGIAGNDKVTIVMADVLGQTIFSKTVIPDNGSISERVNVGTGLANGNYLVTITAGENHTVIHVTVER